jgi:Glycosyl hydrolase catalytic core
VTRRAIGLAGLLTALALLLPAASAQAVGPTFWGMLPTGNATNTDYNMMHAAKVGLVRRDVYEQDVEPSSGNFTFVKPDAVVGNLASRGIDLLPTLKKSQAASAPPISGQAKTDWDAFVQAVVNRYKPGGSYWSGGASSPYQTQFPGAPAPPSGGLTSWQVLNEPSLPKYFLTNNPVQDYATLLKDTHDAIVGADSNATVVLAGLPGIVVKPPYRAWRWLDQLYGVSGVQGAFDVVAFHPYAHHVWDIPPQMRKLRRVMRNHGDGSKQIWITEFGYGSAPYNHLLNFGVQGQATMLRKTFNLWLARAARWHLRGIVWYEWRDPAQQNPDCSFCSTAGLLNSDYSAKPALGAFEHFTGAGP